MENQSTNSTDIQVPFFTELVSFYKHVNARAPLDEDFDVREIDPEVLKNYDYVAKPFRHSFYCITLFLQGDVTLNSGFWRTSLKKPALYFKTPSQVVSWNKPEKWLQEYFIVFTDKFLRSNPALAEIVYNLPFFQLDKAIPFEIEPDEVQMLTNLYKQVLSEYHSGNEDRFALISSYVHTLLLHVRRLYRKYSEADKTLVEHVADREIVLLESFRRLIRNSIAKREFSELRKPLKYFAQQLSTHPNHLNAIIKSQKKITAIAFLHQEICLEAQTLLYQTDQSIKQIAFSLGFSDSPHFNHFFKKHTGKTPAVFRNEKKL